MKLSNEDILLGEVMNYSLRGLMAAHGKGAGVTKTLQPVYFHVDHNDKLANFAKTLCATKLLEEKDIVVVPSKIVSIIEKRWAYGLTVKNYNRCVNDFAYAKKHLTFSDEKPLTERDQIAIDKIDPKKKIGVRYPADPNMSAYRIAKAIHKIAKINVDVVISDTDGGTRAGLKIINCPTMLATPIGATKGLRFFYCIRVAAAAEAVRNNVQNNPALIVRPYEAAKIRSGIGDLRYKGFLDADKEDEVQSILSD